jgi:hypothetical protein
VLVPQSVVGQQEVDDVAMKRIANRVIVSRPNLNLDIFIIGLPVEVSMSHGWLVTFEVRFQRPVWVPCIRAEIAHFHQLSVAVHEDQVLWQLCRVRRPGASQKRISSLVPACVTDLKGCWSMDLACERSIHQLQHCALRAFKLCRVPLVRALHKVEESGGCAEGF